MGIANVKVAMDLLSEIPKELRKLVAENSKLASELAVYQQRDLAEQIVSEMESKGLGDPDTPFREKVAALIDSGKDLTLVKEAVDLAAPNLSFASVSDESGEHTTSLVDYILGG